jgi:hypothetical protein
VGRKGTLRGLFYLIVTDFVVQTRPADLEELHSLGTIAAGMTGGYMPGDIAGSGRSET